MRIREALKYHYNKHMLTYGLISAVLSIVGAVFVPEAVRAIYKVVNHSYIWTLVGGLSYGVAITIIAIPMIVAMIWIFDRKGER